MIIFTVNGESGPCPIMIDEENVSHVQAIQGEGGDESLVTMKHSSGNGEIYINLPPEEVCKQISEKCLQNFMMRHDVRLIEGPDLSQTHIFPHDEGGNDDHETRI